jgi:hypothetical protein
MYLPIVWSTAEKWGVVLSSSPPHPTPQPQPAGVHTHFLGKMYVICGSKHSYIHLVDLPNNSFQSSQQNPLPQSNTLLELTISFCFQPFIHSLQQ